MRRFGSRIGFAALASLALTAPLFTTTTTTSADAPVEPDYRLVLEDKPTNAAKIFRWGNETWADEFETFRPAMPWESNYSRQVGRQVGMLTLKATNQTRTLWTVPTNHKAKYGRWEARVRVKSPRPRKDNGPWHKIFWELIPSGKYKCGGKNLVIASYTKGVDREVEGYVRNVKGSQFNFSRDPEATTEEFHTFAIEVAPDHITWFVDKIPVATERRPEALRLGYIYKPRFRMEALPGRTMDETWLQMDWVRYYTLARPNAKSIEAPPMQLTSNPAATGTCP